MLIDHSRDYGEDTLILMRLGVIVLYMKTLEPYWRNYKEEKRNKIDTYLCRQSQTSGS